MSKCCSTRLAGPALVWSLAVAAAGLSVAAGCSAPRSNARTRTAPDVVVRVINQHDRAVEVRVDVAGLNRRLGLIAPLSEGRVRIPGHLVVNGRAFGLIARAINAPAALRSQNVVVQPDQTLSWTIAFGMRQEFLAVH